MQIQKIMAPLLFLSVKEVTVGRHCLHCHCLLLYFYLGGVGFIIQWSVSGVWIPSLPCHHTPAVPTCPHHLPLPLFLPGPKNRKTLMEGSPPPATTYTFPTTTCHSYLILSPTQVPHTKRKIKFIVPFWLVPCLPTMQSQSMLFHACSCIFLCSAAFHLHTGLWDSWKTQPSTCHLYPYSKIDPPVILDRCDGEMGSCPCP